MVRPALASQAYIPALTHIRFNGEWATAYNDIAAITVVASVDIEACLPGELLIKALNSFGAESINFQESAKDKAVILSSGRSKLKLPMLPIKDFPFDQPDLKKAPTIDLDRSIMKGIEMCLASVGNDPTHPAQMGVTLDMDPEEKVALLFSTDNFTMSRYETDSAIDLPGDSPIIMPTFFCQQLVALGKAFPEEEVTLYMLPGALLAKFGRVAQLFNKCLVDLEPMEFPRMFDKHCKLVGLKDRLAVIPDNWEPSFDRAMLVLSGEVDKVTKVTVMADNIKLHSSSTMGDADDSMSFDGDELDAPSEPFYIDPSLVLRISKVCGLMAWNQKALSLSDADARFVHLISYCSK